MRVQEIGFRYGRVWAGLKNRLQVRAGLRKKGYGYGRVRATKFRPVQGSSQPGGNKVVPNGVNLRGTFKEKP